MQVKEYAELIKEVLYNPKTNKEYKDLFSIPFESLKKFAGTKIGALGISLTSIFAAYKTFKAVDSKFGLTYNGAYGNTSKSLKSVQDTKSQVDDLQSKVDGYKESLQQIATNNDIDVSGLESVDAIIQKINSVGGISLVDQAEVQKIQVANTQLEGTLKNKQNILSQEQKEAAVDAEKNLKKKVNPNVKKSKDGTYEYVGTNGVAAGTGAEHQNVIDATEQDLKGYQEYSDKIAKLREKQSKATSASESKAIEKQIKEAETAKDKIRSSLDSRQEELSTMMKALSVNGEGVKALSGHSKGFDNLKSIVNAISNKDLNSTEKALSSLNTFFDGSTGKNAIKEELQDAVNSGQDLQTALSSIGLSLNDLGIDKISQLKDYLDKASESAKKTNDYLDGTVDSVTNAFDNTENQDSEWKKMSDYLSQANDLYKKGKIGTDDFQESTQYMFYDKINPDKKGTKFDADAYAEKWSEANEKRKRYFDSDNPMDSANNFISDLKKHGLAKESDDGEITWTKAFDSSAKAAKELNLSVSATETAMKNLSSYGFEFSGMNWNGENLTTYKESLSGIKEIYDKLEDDGKGGYKEQLGTKIEGWDKNVKKYNKDMSDLTKEKVVKIKFEYNLADLKLKLQEAKTSAETSNTNESWGQYNAVQKQTLKQTIQDAKNYTDKNGKNIHAKKAEKNANFQLAGNTADAIERATLLTNDENKKTLLQQQASSIREQQQKFIEDFIHSGENWESYSKSHRDDLNNLNKYSANAKKTSVNTLGVSEDKIQVEAPDEVKRNKKSSKKNKKDTEEKTVKYTTNTDEVDKTDKKIKSDSKKPVEKKVNCKVDSKELDKIDKDINSKNAKQKIVELVGKDNATPIIEKWDNMDAPDKNTKLSGKDQATAIVTLWNSMSADDKFSSLSAEDKATALVSIWNGLTAEQKTAIINGDSSAADKAISKVNAQKIKDKSFSIKAKDNASGIIGSIKSAISSLTGKTVTLTTNHVSNYTTNKSSSGGSGGSHKSSKGSSKGFGGGGGGHFNGTFHPSIPAKAQGTLKSSSVGIPKGEKTLINEVGTEGVVRDGKLNIYNNGYPALVDLKKNDIVFNHKQMEELEKKGYITNSHAKIVGGMSAFASGTVDDLNDVFDNDYLDDITAYAHGSLNGITARAKTGKGGHRPGYYTSSTSTNNNKKTTKSTASSKSKSNSGKSKKKNTKKGKTALEKFQKWFEKFFDWIEERLKKLQTQTERFEKKAENSRTLSGRNSNYENAYKNTNKEISANQKGEARYKKQANTVKKQAIKKKIVKPKQAKNLIKKIQNGTININAYGEKTQEFIKSYQEYWDKAEDCRTNQLDLQQQLYELEQKKLDSITDYYDTVNDLYKSEQDIYSSENEMIRAKGGSEDLNSTYHKNLISQRSKQASQTSILRQEANAYAKELQTARKRFGANSEEALAAQTKYNEIVKSLNESKTSYEELNEQIREVTYNLKQIAIDKWTSAMDKLSSLASLISVKNISNKERDSRLEQTYKNQMTTDNNIIVANQDMINIKKQRLVELKNTGDPNLTGEKAVQIRKEILDLENDNYDRMQHREEKLNDIIELRFDKLKRENEILDNNISDMDHLIDLMGDAEIVADDGKITDTGNAQILLNSNKIQQAQTAIANYQKGLDALGNSYTDTSMSEEEWIEKKRELIEAQQKEASTVKESRNAILQIYKNSLQKENELLQKNIDKRKDALQKKKDYYNYDKTLKEKNKNINILQNEIAALEGTSSAAGKARLEELKAQLKDAQDDYNETVRDHEDELRSEGYDKVSEDASNALDKTLTALDSNSKMQTDVVNKMLDGMVESYDEAYAKIRDIIATSGTSVDTFTKDITNKTQTELRNNIENVKNGTTTSTVDDINVNNIGRGENADKADDILKKQELNDSTVNGASKIDLSEQQAEWNRQQTIKAQQEAAKKQKAAQQAKKAQDEKNKKIESLRAGLVKANESYANAWGKTERHVQNMKESSWWKNFTDSKKKKVKAHESIGTKGLKKGKGLDAAKTHNNLVEKEFQAKKTAQDYINQLSKYGVKESLVNPSKIMGGIKGFAKGGIANELVPVNDITKVIPTLSNVITSNGDEGLITARLGEMILPEKPVKNLVPDFISNVEKANTMMKNGGMGDINIENNLIVQGSIDKDTFPGVKKMQEMSYDYIVKQLTDQRQKSGYKTKL